MRQLSAFPPEGAPVVESSLTSKWSFPGKAAMGCIVCVTTSAGAEGEESPLLSKSLSSSNSGIASRDKSLKKNRPGLGDKPQAVTSFRVRGALQSLLPKRSQAHSVPNIDEYAGEDDGWQKEAKDITETRELHLERDHLGNTYVNQYIIVRNLGRGSFGKVKLCLNTNDRKLYAVKSIDKKQLRQRGLRMQRPGQPPQDPLAPVMREVAIMKKLSHMNIVRLFEVIDDPDGQFLFLVLEYIEMGAICTSDQMEQQPESVAWRTFRDICKGLDYLHFNHVIHRDLKPENLLRSADGIVKISDFGVSELFGDEDVLNRTAGTPAFLAPEVVSGGDYRGQPADVWAMGVCLYTFLFGAVPFKGNNLVQVYENIKNEELAFDPEVEISADCQDLLVRILTKDPDSRITLPQVMEHTWVTKNGVFPLAPFGTSPEAEQITVTDAEIADAVEFQKMTSSLKPVLKEVEFRAGEYIMIQGEEGEHMYFIEEGEVEVLYDGSKPVADHDSEMDSDDFGDDDLGDVPERPGLTEAPGASPSGAKPAPLGPQVINTAGKGDFIGEIAVFSELNLRTASVRAKTAVKALQIGRDDALVVLGGQPEVIEEINRVIVKRRQQNTVAQTLSRMGSSINSPFAPFTPRSASQSTIAKFGDPSVKSSNSTISDAARVSKGHAVR